MPTRIDSFWIGKGGEEDWKRDEDYWEEEERRRGKRIEGKDCKGRRTEEGSIV